MPKKSNNCIFSVEKAIYTGEFNLIEFSLSLSDSSYYNYLMKSKLRIEQSKINLHGISDLFLRRRIVEFFIYSVEEKSLLPDSLYVYRIKILGKLLHLFEEEFKKPYFKFINESIELIKEKYGANAYYRGFIHSFVEYCDIKDSENNKFENDRWFLKDFNLSPERLPATTRTKSINFHNITNEKNKFYAKKYIEYTLCNTDNAISTIWGKLTTIKAFFSDVDRPLDEWDDNYSDQVINKLISRYNNQKITLASRVIVINHFMEFLLLHDYIDSNPIKKYKNLMKIGTFRHTTNSVPDTVESQIINVLKYIDEKWVLLIFLLIYSVGMRVSEACSMKKDCLEHRQDNEFIRYYSLKMKKEVTNLIPLSLSQMIAEYIQKSDNTSEYLFHAFKNKQKPIAPYTFTKRMNELFVAHNVKNPDGSLYHFKAHSFRHNMAVKMRRMDIPFEIIQEQLHHSSPEMTLAYVEYIDRDIIRKMDQYIDKNGKDSDFKIDFSISENKEYAEYMRKSINAQMLPNGICARPVSLGRCQHCNSCLDCDEFRTSKAYLNVHKEHLKNIDQYLKIAEGNGWLPQIESNKRIKNLLVNIIKRLEEIDDE